MNSSETFLQNLIDSHYVNYLDMPILLSVYDAGSKLRFTTNFAKKFYNIIHFYEPTEGTPPNNLFAIDGQLKSRVNERNSLIEKALTSNSIIVIVHFDRLGDKFGALLTTATPIVNSKHEVCGVVTQSQEFTTLFFGGHHLNIGTNRPQLNQLTKRQQDILYLWALDFTQEEIANLLGIVRGSVTKTIDRMAHKFNVPSSNKHIMFATIDRQYVLDSLIIPDVDIPPRIVSVSKNPSM